MKIHRSTKMTRKNFLLGASAGIFAAATPAFSADPTQPPNPKTSHPDRDKIPAPAPEQTSTESVHEIAPGVFVHQGVHGIYTPQNRGDISNAAFIIGDSAVAIIDTGGTYKVGLALRNTVRAKTQLPIKYVINTHMHPDHVFGNAAFVSDKPEFVAHHKMARGLSARAERYIAINKKNVGENAFAGTTIVLPTLPIKQSTTLDLGARKITLDPQATAHTDNDLVITDERTGTLFLGDLLFSGHCPSLDGSILGWLRVIETLKQKPAARVVPGHGPAHMPWPDALIPQQRYLQAITDDVRKLIAQGKTLREAMAVAAHSETKNWLLSEEFHQRNVSVAYAELEWE